MEGKKSLPVLIYLNSEKDKMTVLSSLFESAAKDGIESPSVEKAIALLSQSGAIDSAKRIGEEQIREGLNDFSSVFGTENLFMQKINALFTSMIPQGNGDLQ